MKLSDQLSLKQKNFVIGTLLLIEIIIIIKTAWISDDACITLRSVMNFIHGYGPVFNVGERVQAFTHPLWFFLLSLFSIFFKNIFYATFALSIFVSVASYGLFLIVFCKDSENALIASLVLLLSKAYVDFSTSGLENPLSHLMILVGVFYGFRFFETKNVKYAFLSLLVMCTTCLSRPDLPLLIAPFCILILCNLPKTSSKPKIIAIALAPSIVWTVFSIIYYGFPFPNAAYAKLGSGIRHIELIRQGFFYFIDSFYRDPITLTFICINVILGLRRPGPGRAIAAGILLYLLYVLTIGGDFMSGRFLTCPLIASAIIFVRSKFLRSWEKYTYACVLLLGAFSVRSTLLSNIDYDNGKISNKGIADERGYYYPESGLLTHAPEKLRQPNWGKKENQFMPAFMIGYLSLIAGPDVYLIDTTGLTDPLLARLPAKFTPDWRIGHFYRQVPTNYEESLREGRNLLADDDTKIFWQNLNVITRGPIFNLERFKSIFRFNLGLEKKPDFQLYRYGHVPYRDTNSP